MSKRKRPIIELNCDWNPSRTNGIQSDMFSKMENRKTRKKRNLNSNENLLDQFFDDDVKEDGEISEEDDDEILDRSSGWYSNSDDYNLRIKRFKSCHNYVNDNDEIDKIQLEDPINYQIKNGHQFDNFQSNRFDSFQPDHQFNSSQPNHQFNSSQPDHQFDRFEPNHQFDHFKPNHPFDHFKPNHPFDSFKPNHQFDSFESNYHSNHSNYSNYSNYHSNQQNTNRHSNPSNEVKFSFIKQLTELESYDQTFSRNQFY